MKLKTILILFICLICQLSCLAYNENITDDSDYKNIMNDVRQRNLNEQILQTENQTQTTEEQIILPVKNSEIPVIATIRDKETDVIPEQTDIFIPDNNQYLDDFEEDNTVVPLSSPTSTTVIPQHYNSKESDNNWGLLLIFTIVVLYCILGWKLDYSYSSSSDNTEDTDKPQDKSAPRNLYNHNIKENINPINNNENSYWHNIQNKVYEKYGRECFMCGSRMNIDVHHKIPRSEGGTNIIENLIPLCRDCHQKMHKHKFKDDENYVIDNNYGRYINKNKIKEKGYIISSAIKNHNKLKICYRKKDFQNNNILETTRIISPKYIRLACEIKNNNFIKLSNYDNNRNIVFIEAYCYLRNAERLFRLDRLEILEVIKA